MYVITEHHGFELYETARSDFIYKLDNSIARALSYKSKAWCSDCSIRSTECCSSSQAMSGTDDLADGTFTRVTVVLSALTGVGPFQSTPCQYMSPWNEVKGNELELVKRLDTPQLAYRRQPHGLYQRKIDLPDLLDMYNVYSTFNKSFYQLNK